MKVEIEVSDDTIANLFCSAIESGDPVTTARKGGWCEGIYWQTKRHKPLKCKTGYWYAEAATYARNDFKVTVNEVTNERTGAITAHVIDRAAIAKGLANMARVFPHQFAQILSDEIDAPCADAFLQAVCFGQEVYA